jgi:signal transduction histidine kinase
MQSIAQLVQSDLNLIPAAPPLSTFNPSHMATAGLTEVAHEARNMVAALELYCDLLETPGVLAPAYLHYGGELKMVASASRRLVDRLMTLCEVNVGRAVDGPAETALLPVASGESKSSRYWEYLPPTMIRDLSWELQANRNLLAALAGPSIVVTLDAVGGALPVRLTSEDMTRILVNLVKNSAEAMPDGGHIQLILRETAAGPDDDTTLLLNVEDNGTGIPSHSLESIFEAGYTTHTGAGSEGDKRTSPHADHRGLGLSITRSIVESAGGHIRAAHREPSGACFQIELPVRTA